MHRVQRQWQRTRVPGIALMAMLVGLVCLPRPVSPAAPSITGTQGDSVYLTDIDTLDVKILLQDGVPVLTNSIIGYGTVAERNATFPSIGTHWWVTDGNPPFFSRFDGEAWERLGTDPTWPVAPQVLQAAHQITGCGVDRVTTRLVSVEGDGGAVSLTSNPQIPAGADGQVCILWGSSASNTVTVADGNGIELDGISTYTISTTQSLTLAYSTITNRWRQLASSAPPGTGGGGTTGLIASQTVSGLSGASVAATNLIPANSWVFGVTINVTTTITGATSFDVGDGTHQQRWGDNIAISSGTQTTLANTTISTLPLYGTATNVVLTANGGNFTAGQVEINVYYVTLTSLTAGAGGGGGGSLPAGSANQILRRTADNTGVEFSTLDGTTGQVNVAFSPGVITLSTPQSTATSFTPTYAGMTLTQGTLTASTPLTHTAAFNNAGVTFVGETHDFTDTASATASQLARWRVGGTEKVTIRKDGELKASSVRLGVVTVTSSTTIAPDASFVLCDATSGAVTLTLPDASTRGTGSPVWIKKSDPGPNYCTIVRSGADTIEGNTTGLALQIQYQSKMLVPGGADLWLVF